MAQIRACRLATPLFCLSAKSWRQDLEELPTPWPWRIFFPVSFFGGFLFLPRCCFSAVLPIQAQGDVNSYPDADSVRSVAIVSRTPLFSLDERLLGRRLASTTHTDTPASGPPAKHTIFAEVSKRPYNTSATTLLFVCPRTASSDRVSSRQEARTAWHSYSVGSEPVTRERSFTVVFTAESCASESVSSRSGSTLDFCALPCRRSRQATADQGVNLAILPNSDPVEAGLETPNSVASAPSFLERFIRSHRPFLVFRFARTKSAQ